MQLEFIAPAIMFLFFGAHSGWTTWPAAARGYWSRQWPNVPGVVVGGYVADADGHVGAFTFSAGVRYLYMVEGESYRSSVISFKHALAFFSIGAVARAKAPYPEGAEVRVYYDPENPRVAVLEPGISFMNAVACALSTSFVLTGLLILRAGLVP